MLFSVTSTKLVSRNLWMVSTSNPTRVTDIPSSKNTSVNSQKEKKNNLGVVKMLYFLTSEGLRIPSPTRLGIPSTICPPLLTPFKWLMHYYSFSEILVMQGQLKSEDQLTPEIEVLDHIQYSWKFHDNRTSLGWPNLNTKKMNRFCRISLIRTWFSGSPKIRHLRSIWARS